MGAETKRAPERTNGRPGAHAHRHTVDPAIPRQVASPQSLTPLRRTSSIVAQTEKKSMTLDTFRGRYSEVLDCVEALQHKL